MTPILIVLVVAVSLALILWILRRESQEYSRARRRQAKQRRKILRRMERDERKGQET